jgi:hypothetical protein
MLLLESKGSCKYIIKNRYTHCRFYNLKSIFAQKKTYVGKVELVFIFYNSNTKNMHWVLKSKGEDWGREFHQVILHESKLNIVSTA